VIFGFSGYIGLGQDFAYILKNQVRPKQSDSLPWSQVEKARDELRKLFWQRAKTAYEEAHHVGSSYGQPQFKVQEVSHQIITAFPIAGKPVLVHFDDKCQPEEVHPHFPTVAIGSGQAQADSILAFIRSILWPGHDKQPSLAEGVFAVLWTLKIVIKATPGGIAEPVQVIILERVNNRWAARELTKDDFQEHYERIAKVEEGIRQVVVYGSPMEQKTSPMPEKMNS
jgi:hypothetical protein